MNLTELQHLEASLSISLPDYYRATMLEYPFAGRSEIDAAELVDSVQQLLELNCESPVAKTKVNFFVIGTDLSEEIYYIKPQTSASEVFCFELETGNSRLICTSWEEYLTLCRTQLEEIELDSHAMVEKAATTKWWQLW